MKPIQIVRECAAQFPTRSLVHQHMHVNIHCPELLEILKWNERLATEDGGRVLGDKQKLGRFVRRNIQRFNCRNFLVLVYHINFAKHQLISFKIHALLAGKCL